MYALQRLLYGFPEPAPHKRSKPVEVLCLGLPRTGTESLSVALRTLGLPAYHGWDLVFEPDGSKLQHCTELVRRKYNGARDGDVQITSAEFDILLGDNQAVVDSLSILFAPELLAAYPDAKVILNVRPDINAWYRSIDKTIVQEVDQSWTMWGMQWFSAEFHWLYSLYLNHGYPGVFHSVTTTDGIQRNAKWVYRDHCNMVRGMVPKDKLLEWSVEDGWEPLCKVCFGRIWIFLKTMADDRYSFSTSLFQTSPSPELILQEVTPSAQMNSSKGASFNACAT